MAHLLFILAFPLKAWNFMSKHSKIAHIVEVAVVLVVSILPGVITLSISEYHFDRFPPNICYPNISVFFYTFTMPLEICATIGLAMLFLAFSYLRQVRKFDIMYFIFKPPDLFSYIYTVGYNADRSGIAKWEQHRGKGFQFFAIQSITNNLI